MRLLHVSQQARALKHQRVLSRAWRGWSREAARCGPAVLRAMARRSARRLAQHAMLTWQLPTEAPVAGEHAPSTIIPPQAFEVASDQGEGDGAGRDVVDDATALATL